MNWSYLKYFTLHNWYRLKLTFTPQQSYSTEWASSKKISGSVDRRYTRVSKFRLYIANSSRSSFSNQVSCSAIISALSHNSCAKFIERFTDLQLKLISLHLFLNPSSLLSFIIIWVNFMYCLSLNTTRFKFNKSPEWYTV